MQAVIRTYSGTGAKELIAIFEEHKKEIEELIRPVTGLVSYSLINTGDGGLSVTLCSDKAGIDESIRLAADWIRRNVPNTSAGAPRVDEGTIIVQIA